MNTKNLQNGLREFVKDNKSTGVCCLNTKSGHVEMEFGSSEIVKRMNEIIRLNKGYQNINSQFNSLFYKREIPELISVKSKGENRFIKFLDSQHIVLAVSELDDLNYAKIKIQLSQILINEDD